MSPEDFYEPEGYEFEHPDCEENDNTWLGLLLLLGALGTAPQPINPFLSNTPEPFNVENSELEHRCEYPWNSYGKRTVACDIVNDFVIDTALVPDRAPFNYETAVKHPEFHYAEWLVISYATTKEEAKEMHKRQVEYFKEHPDVTMIYEVFDRIWYSRDIDMGEHK